VYKLCKTSILFSPKLEKSMADETTGKRDLHEGIKKDVQASGEEDRIKDGQENPSVTQKKNQGENEEARGNNVAQCLEAKDINDRRQDNCYVLFENLPWQGNRIWGAFHGKHQSANKKPDTDQLRVEARTQGQRPISVELRKMERIEENKGGECHGSNTEK
jgi:hypothetical protein